MQQFKNKDTIKQPTFAVWVLIALIIFSFMLASLPGGNLINKILGIVLVVTTLLSKINNRSFRITSEVLVILIWTLYGLTISMFSIDPFVSINRAYTMFQLIFLVFLTVNVIGWSKNGRLFCYAYIIGAVMTFGISFTGFSQIGGTLVGQEAGRTVGTLVDANRFALAMVEAQFLTYFLLATTKKKYEILILLSFTLLFGLAVVKSGSRAGLASFIITSGFAGWAFGAYNVVKKPLVFVVSLLVLYGMFTVGSIVAVKNTEVMKRYIGAKDIIVSGDIKAESSGRSIQNRVALAKLALKIALEHPFGVGLNNFSVIVGGFSHSNPLELLATTGFIGLPLFYLWYLIFFLKAIRLPQNAFGSKSAWRLIVVFPLVLAVLDIGLVNYYAKDYWFCVAMVIGLVEITKSKAVNKKEYCKIMKAGKNADCNGN